MKDSDFEELVASVRQAGQIRRGELTARQFEVRPEDIKAIRARFDKSQTAFALMIGVSVGTLQNWEQGRRKPDGPARALLRVAATHPEAVETALDPRKSKATDKGSRAPFAG